MRQNPHVRICGGPGSATTLVYPTAGRCRDVTWPRSWSRMAVENPQWGYTRIRGALSNLGHEIARTTVKRILHDHGIDPAPARSRRMPGRRSCRRPGRASRPAICSPPRSLAGLQRYLVFFVIALQSRRVTIAGIHPQPYGAWMEQMARNLTDPVDGCLRRARYLIHDRDPLSTQVFGEILAGGGVQPIRLPPKSPNLNAYAERFVRSIKGNVSVASSLSAKGTCVSSWARTSTTTIASDTTRDSTTSSCNDRHRR